MPLALRITNYVTRYNLLPFIAHTRIRNLTSRSMKLIVTNVSAKLVSLTRISKKESLLVINSIQHQYQSILLIDDRIFAKILLILACNPVRYTYVCMYISSKMFNLFILLSPSPLPRAGPTLPSPYSSLGRKRSCSCWSTVCHVQISAFVEGEAIA